MENNCDGTCAPKECICEQTRKDELKEDKKQFGIEYDLSPKYSIEQIKKAIDETMPHKYRMAWDNERFKNLFINNLTK